MPKRKRVIVRGESSGSSGCKSARLNSISERSENNDSIVSSSHLPNVQLSLQISQPVESTVGNVENGSTDNIDNNVPHSDQPVASGSGIDSSDNEQPRIISLAEAARFLPEFDGNNISVNTFIQMCRRVESLLSPPDRSIFICTVRSKITGRASKQLDFQDYRLLDDLFEDLKRIFAPSQDFTRIQTDLTVVKQEPKETVIDYGLRVRHSLNRAFDLIKQDFDPHLTAGMIESVKRLAIQKFLEGLNRRVANHIILKKFDNLESAIDIATKYEESFRTIDSRYSNIQNNRTQNYITARDKNSNNSVKVVGIKGEIEKIRCYNCNQVGHMARNCNVKKEIKREYPHQDKVCYNCGKKEHIKPDCRAKIVCRYCNLAGHIEKFCRKKKSDEGNGGNGPGKNRAGDQPGKNHPGNEQGTNLSGNSNNQLNSNLPH